MTTRIPVSQLFDYIAYDTDLYTLSFVIYDKTVGGTETYYIPEESDGFGFTNNITIEPTYTPDINNIIATTLAARKLTFTIAFHGSTPAEYWTKRQAFIEGFSPDSRNTPYNTDPDYRSQLVLIPTGMDASLDNKYLFCLPSKLTFLDQLDGLNGEVTITFLAADPYFYDAPSDSHIETVTDANYGYYPTDLTTYQAKQRPRSVIIDARQAGPSGATIVTNPIIIFTHRDGSTQKLSLTTVITDREYVIFDFYRRSITKIGLGPDDELTKYLSIDSDFDALYFDTGDSVNVQSTRTANFIVTITTNPRQISL